MNSIVVDASAVLALLQQEAGTEMLTLRLMSRSVISSVNLAEVHTKLVLGGGGIEPSWMDALATVNAVEPFSEAHAKIAGSLVKKTREYGLSLGDRACLALAISLGAPVYTADQIWQDLKIGIPVHVIR